MQIKDLFSKDINRPINGVVKVSQDDNESICQELSEYVVTRELQRHFADFFESYTSALDVPTDRVGVWISGFFGSGKSHFLKMLSYLLENDEVGGRRAIEYFDGKLEDPFVYNQMKRAVSVPTETILFNIDDKASQWKEGATAKTALLRAFARVFYEHRGFYGANLNLARLEAFIDEQGKTAEFRRVFEEIAGVNWVENRDAADFYEDDVVDALVQVLGWSEEQARRQFDRVEDEALSPEELVKQIAEYTDARAEACGGNFRLLFMVDEVGQFIGSDVNLMLNLQTIVEDLGARCRGRVWVMVTSQEAIDEVTKVAGNDFSKIQGRFNTRLSLSSSSVDEVIKRRVLDKTPEAAAALEQTYAGQSAVLKNLFTFEESQSDLRGYAGAQDFCESYPFVGYQFKIMSNVLAEIRRHGNAGKHLSGGERSMLSGFQESAQRVQGRELGALVPFWRFYDTLEAFLEHDIRQVLERARRAAEDEAGLEASDVEVLKALYLIRYINDVKPTVGNISLLMVDAIGADKVALREGVSASLARLVRENYVSRTGDTYHFLTNEEQDIAREIQNTQIDAATVTAAIARRVFDDIFTQHKLRLGANDFAFDCYVDDVLHGAATGGMKLNVITLANPLSQDPDGELALRSGNQALVVLGGAGDSGDYYEVLQNATRIRRYAQTKNVSQLPESAQRIIQGKQKEAQACEREARSLIEEAIKGARVAVDGRVVDVRAQNASKKLEGALEELVHAVYTKAGYIGAPVADAAAVGRILAGGEEQSLAGIEGPNMRATEDMAQFLESQALSHQQTALADVRSRYSKPPYGWRDDDIAATVARLVASQRAEVSRLGAPVPVNDPKLVGYLTKRAEDGRVRVAKREKIDEHLLRSVRKVLRELPGVTSVPEDEDSLAEFARKTLQELHDCCHGLLASEYARAEYPGRDVVYEGDKLTVELLQQKNDARSLFRAIHKAENDLLDFCEDFEDVRSFFPNQQRIYDESLAVRELMKDEEAYLKDDATAMAAIKGIREVLLDPAPWSRIRDLGPWNAAVRTAHKQVLGARKNELLDRLESVVAEIKVYAEGRPGAAPVLTDLERARLERKNQMHAAQTVTQLEAAKNRLDAFRDEKFVAIDEAEEAAEAAAAEAAARKASAGLQPYGGQNAAAAQARPAKPTVPKVTKVDRATLCPPKKLATTEDVEAYVEEFRQRLLAELSKHGPIRLG